MQRSQPLDLAYSLSSVKAAGTFSMPDPKRFKPNNVAN
jgi:hypothetical protein